MPPAGCATPWEGGDAPGPGGHNTNSAAPELADEQEPGPHRRKVSVTDMIPTAAQERAEAIAYWRQRVEEARHALDVAERSLAALLEGPKGWES